MRACLALFTSCLLLSSTVALGGAAPEPPEDREVPASHGQLRLKDDAYKRLAGELKDAAKPLDQRVEIVGLFAYFRDARAVPQLVAAVAAKAEPMALKTAALWALGEIGDPRAMPAFQYALNQMYVKDPEKKNTEWTQAKGVIVEADGKERTISLRAVCEGSLGRLAEPVLPRLTDALVAPSLRAVTPEKPPEDDEAAGHLRAALISVAAVGDRSPTAIQALTTVLTADDKLYPWDFKIIAVEALSSILVRRFEEFKEMKARDKLSDDIAVAFIQAFAITELPEVRETGGAALRRVGRADRAGKGLVALLKTPGLPKAVRYHAIEALASLESPEAASQLVFLLFDPDRNIRWRAAVALGTCGDKRAAEYLRQVMKDKDPFVRVKAIAALGHLNTATVLPDLAVALEDPDYRVRRQAALALGRLGQRQAIPALVNRGLKDSSPWVRAASIIALGYITRSDGLKAVPPMLADKDPGVRLVAVQVLDKFLNPGATRALIAALGDSDLAVREEAVKAVPDRIQRGPKEVLALLTDAIAKTQGMPRLAAIQCVDSDYRKLGAAKDARRRALYDALMAAPDAPLAAALIAALKDENERVRAAAGKLLADHGWAAKNRELLDAAAALANDASPLAREVGGKARNFLNNLPKR